MKYPSPLVNALTDGAVLDMRMKFAMDLLRAPGFLRHFDVDHIAMQLHVRAADVLACAALDIAQALYAEAEKRELIRPLPIDDIPLPPAELRAIERSAGAQVHAQVHQQKIVQGMQPTITAVGQFRGMNG